MRRLARSALIALAVGVVAVQSVGISASAAGSPNRPRAMVDAVPHLPTAGEFLLHNRVTTNGSFCVGIANGNAGAWPCNSSGADQIWHQDFSVTHFDGFGTPYNRLMNRLSQCLGVAGGATAQGSPVVGARCVDHPDQFWSPVGPHVVDLTASNNRVLAVSGGNVTTAQPLVIFGTFSPDHPDQDWIGS